MAELKLNGLEKTGVVLEEYSHCEVPAGCGGVVLRWVRPGGPVTLRVDLVATAQAAVWVDGVVVQRAEVVVKPGSHVLCVQAPAPVMVRLRLERQQVAHAQMVSAPDGSWRCAAADGSTDWLQPDFDDHTWTPMVHQALPTFSKGLEKWMAESLQREGAQPLGPAAPWWKPGLTGELRLRRAFTVGVTGLQ